MSRSRSSSIEEWGQGPDGFPAPEAGLRFQLADRFGRADAFGLLDNLSILARRGRTIAFLETGAAPRIPPLLEGRREIVAATVSTNQFFLTGGLPRSELCPF